MPDSCQHAQGRDMTTCRMPVMLQGQEPVHTMNGSGGGASEAVLRTGARGTMHSLRVSMSCGQQKAENCAFSLVKCYCLYACRSCINIRGWASRGAGLQAAGEH